VQPGGVVDVGGLLNLDEFAEQTGLRLPEGPYETAAGYVMAALGALPALHDTVELDGWTITVAELDGRRVARLRVAPPGPEPQPGPPAESPPGSQAESQAGPQAEAQAGPTPAAAERPAQPAPQAAGTLTRR
jgi:hypothetical protein